MCVIKLCARWRRAARRFRYRPPHTNRFAHVAFCVTTSPPSELPQRIKRQPHQASRLLYCCRRTSSTESSTLNRFSDFQRNIVNKVRLGTFLLVCLLSPSMSNVYWTPRQFIPIRTRIKGVHCDRRLLKWRGGDLERIRITSKLDLTNSSHLT